MNDNATIAPDRVHRKVLLVGAAGYVGSVLTGQLLAAGYAVRGADALLYGNAGCILPHLSSPHYEFLNRDLAGKDSFESALGGVTDVVFLAGLVGDPITKKYPDASQRINSAGMKSAIASLAGRRLDRVIFISTCSNYGLIPENVEADEDYELKPLSLYATAKVEIERLLLGLKGKVDFHPTVLRFATAFGLSPRMRFDLTVSEFTREMYLKRELQVFDAHTWRPYCHVLDLADAVQRTLEAPLSKVDFEVFNVGGAANNATKQRIVDEILAVLPGSPVTFKERGSDPRNYRVSFQKIHSTLGFEPQRSITFGIGELVAALEQRLFDSVDENRNFFGNYEIHYPAA
jgi:nucleoside-diphosphate-sugar epimerase